MSYNPRIEWLERNIGDGKLVPKPTNVDEGKIPTVDSNGEYELTEPVFKAGEGTNSAILDVPLQQNTASGALAIAVGGGTVASAQAAFSGGTKSGNTKTLVSGASSFAYGMGCTVSGQASQAFGQLCETTGNLATSFGSYSKSNARTQFVIGQSNVIDENPVDTAHGNGARKYIFIIGNGSSNGSTRSNALTVDWDGNVVCNNIPAPPAAAGTYSLTCTVDSSGNASYSWA